MLETGSRLPNAGAASADHSVPILVLSDIPRSPFWLSIDFRAPTAFGYPAQLAHQQQAAVRVTGDPWKSTRNEGLKES